MMEQGLCILRLSYSEFWIVDISNTNQDFIQDLELASEGLSDVYRLYCQYSHGVFSINGTSIREMFSKVCGVDLSLSVFQSGSIAQTSVARVNSIVVCMNAGESDSFLLLSDIASAAYLWDAIRDAAEEFA
jgi:sarcosine oxidase subunit gamma